MTNAINTGVNYGYITEALNAIVALKYLYTYAPANILTRSADKVPAQEKSGSDVVLFRTNKIPPTTQPVINGIATGTTTTSQDKFRSTINQYSICVQTDAMTQDTYGGTNNVSWAKLMEDQRLVMLQSLSEGAEIKLSEALKGGTVISIKCIDPATGDFEPITTLTWLSQAVNRLANNYAVSFTNVIEPDINISTTGVNASYLLFVTLEQVSQLKELPQFTSVYQYGAGSRERISSKEAGTLKIAGTRDLRVLYVEIPEFNIPAKAGAAGDQDVVSSYVVSRDSMAMVSTSQTSFKDLDKGTADYTLKQMVDMYSGIDMFYVNKDISNDPTGGNYSLQTGSIATGRARYAPMLTTTTTLVELVTAAN